MILNVHLFYRIIVNAADREAGRFAMFRADDVRKLPLQAGAYGLPRALEHELKLVAVEKRISQGLALDAQIKVDFE